jgi:hypothetical protein
MRVWGLQPRGTHAFTHVPGTEQVATVNSRDAVTLAYTWTGPLLRGETWSGAVNGIVERTRGSDFAVTLKTLNGSWPVAYSRDADGLVTGAGALTITRRASDGLLSGTSAGVVTSVHSYDSHGEPWKPRCEAVGTLLYEEELRRDSLGRVVEVVERGLRPRTVAYRHDAVRS